jgi:hypothetical protein
MKKYLLSVFFLWATLSANGQINYDHLQVSLLTVEPRPNEVYTVFGHTALRLFDPVNNTDAVLSWGTFNSRASAFLYHFIKGETNYMLSINDYVDFYYEYMSGNATVIEQILHIPNENKDALIAELALNLEPGNREYRYNFLFDNCSTRPHDIIEKFCGGNLIYPAPVAPTTFRDLIHSCTQPYPWMTFGIDLVIGSGADSLLTFRRELFLPEKLMNALEQATVIGTDGANHSLVVSSGIIIQSSPNEPPVLRFWDSPLKTGIFILLIYAVLIITGYFGKKQEKANRIAFAFLFLMAGLAGCVIFFLSFFSQHPCVQYNWNILWLHPLHFAGAAGFLLKKSYSLIRWYHGTNLLLLSFLLLAGFWIPQQLNPANIPYLLCLGIVSGYWILKTKKSHE